MSISPEMLGVVAAALDASDDILLVLEAEPSAESGLRLVEASDAFLRFIGHGWAQLIHQPLDIVLAPSQDATRLLAQAVQAGTSLRGDLACLTRDGRRLWLGLHLMPAGGDGEAARFVLIGRDITARRAEADQARQLQGMLVKVFMLAGAPLAIVGPDERLMMTNPCFDRTLGRAPGSLAGQPALDHVAPEFQAPVVEASRRQAANGHSYAIDLELRRQGAGAIRATLFSAVVRRLDTRVFQLLTLTPHGPAAPCPEKLPDRMQIAGRIRFISLEAVKSLLKDRWGEVAARVLDTAERMIRRRLNGGETVTRTPDQGFILCFADTAEPEASLRAAAIGREIRHHLIGEGEDAETVEMSAVVGQVRLVGSDPPATQIGRQLDRVEAEARSAAAAGTVPPFFDTVFHAGNAEALGHYIQIASAQNAGGALVFPESLPEQDLRALRCAAGTSASRATTPLCVDVNFETFLGRARSEAYFEACYNLPIPVRQRLHVILSALPKGTTQSLLNDVMRRLKTACSGVGFRLADLQPPAFDIAACRPNLAVIDMRRWDRGVGLAPARLQRVAALIHAHKARLLAIHVARAQIGQQLHIGGVDWITLESSAS